MIELIFITIACMVVYILMGISVYKLCKSSSMGALCDIEMWVILVWPILLIIGGFTGDVDD